MHGRSAFVLVAVVLALGGAVVWQRGREASGAFAAEEALCPGIDAARVHRIRIESQERAQMMVLERDSEGDWSLTEPIAYPANATYARFLLQVAQENRVQPIPAAEADPAALGLEPPRAVIELFESLADGTERVHAVEIGAVDPDRQRVAVRTRGRLGRTARNLDTTLDRGLDDFRSRAILALEPRTVVELHRTGRMPALGVDPERDLALDALSEGGHWSLTAPWRSRLDPAPATYLLVAACQMEAASFVDDLLEPMSALGLDPPTFSVVLVELSGARHELRLGAEPGGRRWFCTRAGDPWIWEIDPVAARILATPADGLVDRRVVRAARDDLRAVRLRRAGGELRVRLERGRWMLSERSASADAFGPEIAAEPSRVADLLGRIESAELGGSVPGAAFADSGEAFFLDLAGEVQGGVFGPAHVLASGDSVRLFLREGDDLVQWADPELASIAAVTAESLRSTSLLAGVEESRTARLEISGLGKSRAFVRDSRGLWRAEGSEIEARELHAVLDPLFFLRAAEHVPIGSELPLEDPIEVVIVDESGGRTRIALGRTPGSVRTQGAGGAPGGAGRGGGDVGGRRSVLADQGLHAALAALLDRR